MKQREIETTGPTEVRLIRILSSFGWPEIKAKCAVYFTIHDRAYSRDMEKVMNLRQPEVSIGLKSLIEDGLIERKMEDHKKYCGRGRRRIIFLRKLSKEDYAEALAAVGNKKIQEIEELIRQCKEMKKEVALRAKKQNMQ